MVRKENLPLKTGKKLSEKLLCVRLIHLTITAFPSRSLSLRHLLGNLQSDIWKAIEGYGEEGNIFRSKLERSFLRMCFVMCAFHSERHTSFLKRQCLNTVLVKLKKWYFAAHWRLWWKVKLGNKTLKAALHETALWRVHSFQRVKAYTTLPS